MRPSPTLFDDPASAIALRRPPKAATTSIGSTAVADRARIRLQKTSPK
jgi:hypothetical protein